MHFMTNYRSITNKFEMFTKQIHDTFEEWNVI